MLDAAMADIAISRNNELVSAVQRDEELIKALNAEETPTRGFSGVRRDAPIMFNLGDEMEMLQAVSTYELASIMRSPPTIFSDQETLTDTGEILDAAILNLPESRIHRVGQPESENADAADHPNTPTMYVTNSSPYNTFSLRNVWSTQRRDDVPPTEVGD